MTNRISPALKRLLSAISIFFVFVYLTVLLCSIPGDFTITMEDGKLTPSHIGVFIIKDTNEKFIDLLKLDLGRTGKDGRSLNYLVTETMKNSLTLLAGGFVLAVLLGIPKGITDSRRGSENGSGLKVLGTIIPVSLPDIMIIALLQRLAVFLNKNGIEILRVGGYGTINHMLLPVLALSILPACYIARITSMSIDECYRQDFITAATGKGCSRRRILWNHVMRNAVPAIIDSLPTITSIIIGNLLMVENVFSYPGLTKALVGFFGEYERDGIIASILLIGVIYFLLDALFNMLKWAVVKPFKGESL
ncbi:MAG TPA: ABC transporter permease [Clostridia bacterium]|nr:ABC transporter permease [Clostridia bacterium]